MFQKEIYINRRARLIEKIDKGIILLLGNSEASCNYPDNTYKFRQDSTFLYYYGINEPNLAAILDAESGEQILFGNNVDIDDIIWMGPQPSIADRGEKIGISKTASLSGLEKYLKDAIASKRKIHFIPPYRNYNKIMLNTLLNIPIAALKESSSIELIKAIVDMRLIKDKYELAEINNACNIGYAMHFTAMKMAKLGMVEQDLVGVMEGISASQGSMTSFATILSQNGETLHNHSHHQKLTNGRLIVIDAGAETNMNYCSDFTRTIPSSGKYTKQQKEIYDIVAAANNNAIGMARPGITYTDVHLASCRILASGLKELGLMKGNVDDAVMAGAHALFMPHGLGHNMGLDVHDMEDLGQIYVGYDDTYKPSTQFGLASLRMGKMLHPGHVLTVEPGCYFIPALIEQWKNAGTNAQFINFDKLKEYSTFGGIRLEDDIVVTEKGCKLLGDKRLPITTEEVESEMA
ncbi:MAG: aminopeptidase P family protein [Bacteroidales bacterium]